MQPLKYGIHYSYAAAGFKCSGLLWCVTGSFPHTVQANIPKKKVTSSMLILSAFGTSFQSQDGLVVTSTGVFVTFCVELACVSIS